MDQLSKIDTVLKLVDRELWVVTAAANHRRGGLLATWVAAASIDRERPVLLAGIAPNHFTAELVQASNAFAAHLLRSDQTAVAWNFANGSGRNRDKFAGSPTFRAATGAPILVDCLAWCDCRVFAQYNAGDRLYFWADVMEAGMDSKRPAEASPMREKELLGSLSPEQRDALVADLTADVDLQRPLHDAWRRSLGL